MEEKDECEIHRIWWAFQAYMKKWYAPDKLHGVYDFDVNKMVGYDAIERVEEYVKDHTEIKLVRCGDSTHSCSLLVLIPHRDGENYWGTTVIYVPQHGGYNNEFFLYPEVSDRLKKALEEVCSKP